MTVKFQLKRGICEVCSDILRYTKYRHDRQKGGAEK